MIWAPSCRVRISLIWPRHLAQQHKETVSFSMGLQIPNAVWLLVHLKWSLFNARGDSQPYKRLAFWPCPLNTSYCLALDSSESKPLCLTCHTCCWCAHTHLSGCCYLDTSEGKAWLPLALRVRGLSWSCWAGTVCNRHKASGMSRRARIALKPSSRQTAEMGLCATTKPGCPVQSNICYEDIYYRAAVLPTIFENTVGCVEGALSFCPSRLALGAKSFIWSCGPLWSQMHLCTTTHN